MSTAAGNISQAITDNGLLSRLAGRTITFTLQGKCNTANCLRIGIYDGTTTTYSDYHPGNSAWTEDDEPLKVTTTIAETPTAITLFVYHTNAAGVSYIDDGRVIGADFNAVYIEDLGIHQNSPHKVSVIDNYYEPNVSPRLVHNITYDRGDGFLISDDIEPGDTLLIEGIKPLDFLLAGVPSTSWTSTIDLDEPQLQILTSLAAYHLAMSRTMPTGATSDIKRWQDAAQYWMGEYTRTRSQFGMIAPGATVNWGV
jgi:hypothetical protein